MKAIISLTLRLIAMWYRWRTLLAHSFVYAQKDTLRFCPAPSCDQAVHLSSPSSLPSPLSPTVSCANTHITCFTCALPDGHSPVPCGFASLWRVLLREDARRLAAEAEARLRAEEARKRTAEIEEARRKEEEEKRRQEEEERRKEEEERTKRELEEMLETAYWKAMHSKSCPQCGTPIEKISGCKCVLTHSIIPRLSTFTAVILVTCDAHAAIAASAGVAERRSTGTAARRAKQPAMSLRGRQKRRRRRRSTVCWRCARLSRKIRVARLLI